MEKKTFSEFSSRYPVTFNRLYEKTGEYVSG